MADPEQTDPNPNLRKAEAAAKSVWAWGLAHTLVCSHVAVLLVGAYLGHRFL